jgi:hypothetical protein
MSTQEKGEEEFELVTSTSLDVVHSRLNYSLRMLSMALALHSFEGNFSVHIVFRVARNGNQIKEF